MPSIKYSIETKGEIEFELRCANCNAELRVVSADTTEPHYITVEPCPECAKKAEENS